MSILPEGIIFVREGLSKQDRPGHVGKQIFIPFLKKNIKLDPKRTNQQTLTSFFLCKLAKMFP